MSRGTPLQDEGALRGEHAGNERVVMSSTAAVREGDQRFPRTARLLSAEEFSTLFRMRPVRRSDHFVVYARPRDALAPPSDAMTVPLPARLGLVLGKKMAPRAATRNMVRRTARELFRTQRLSFVGWDVLIRMQKRFDKQVFPGAASPALKRACRQEMSALLDEAIRHIARRQCGQGTPPAPAPQTD